jgi:hypothetical protein
VETRLQTVSRQLTRQVEAELTKKSAETKESMDKAQRVFSGEQLTHKEGTRRRRREKRRD